MDLGMACTVMPTETIVYLGEDIITLAISSLAEFVVLYPRIDYATSTSTQLDHIGV